VEPESSKVGAAPPAWIDSVVRLLFPPVAREATVGDLWERYRSPLQFTAEALRVLPFVIGSQIRRSSSAPILGLQAFILFACFDGFEIIPRNVPLWATAAVPTLAALLGLVTRDVYRKTDRRTIRRGLLDVVTAALCILFSEGVLAGLAAARHLSPDWVLPGRLAISGAMGLPILYILRMGPRLIADADASIGPGRNWAAISPFEPSAAEFALDYHEFERRARWRNRAEVGAGLTTISVAIFFLCRFKPSVAPLGWAFLSCYGCIVALLAANGAVRPSPPGLGFTSLQLLYIRELARQHRVRRFMWWWYFVPLFLGLTIHLVLHGIRSEQPLLSLLGVVVALVLGSCITRLNRDRGRSVQEKIGALASLGERLPSLRP
jgi:hypothetical protein